MDPYNPPCGFGNGPKRPVLAGEAMVMAEDMMNIGHYSWVERL